MIFLIRAKGNSCTRKSFWGQQIDTVKYRIKLKLQLFPFFSALFVCLHECYVPQSSSWSPPWHEARRTAVFAGHRCPWLQNHLQTSSNLLKEKKRKKMMDTRKWSIISKQKTSDMEIRRQIKNVIPLQNKALLHRALPVCQNHISYQSL